MIELLIVVAIIGILAAIAVPNFMAAKLRANVARAVSNMRSVETGLESYFLDNNSYTSRAWDPHYEGFAMLTTPVAYMNGEDAFRNPFKPRNYFSTHVDGREVDPFFELGTWKTSGSAFKKEFPTNAWLLESSGPDFGDDYNANNYPQQGLVYQTSNGLKSHGDIYRGGGLKSPAWVQTLTY